LTAWPRKMRGRFIYELILRAVGCKVIYYLFGIYSHQFDDTRGGMQSAKIIEIFHSLQGEGIYLGEPMTFVRFFGCNLSCNYCDTGYSRDEAKATEMSGEQVIERITALAQPGEFVSLTGGEPLLWANFISEIGGKLKAIGYKLYLETNGTLPDELHKVVLLLDVIAMDIKPPTACGKAYWGTHRHFLAAAGDKAFVKLVVAADTEEEEVEAAARLAAAAGRGLPLVLQPAGGPLAPDMQFVRKCRAAAERHLAQVSIVAQMHKIWGVR
jgi:7-carboxy-7-deazaguanine synthase